MENTDMSLLALKTEEVFEPRKAYSLWELEKATDSFLETVERNAAC